MKAVSSRVTRINEDGTRQVEAVLMANDTPAQLPTTGLGIEGLCATDTFSPMSVLYVAAADAVHKVYLTNEDGVFVAQ